MTPSMRLIYCNIYCQLVYYFIRGLYIDRYINNEISLCQKDFYIENPPAGYMGFTSFYFYVCLLFKKIFFCIFNFIKQFCRPCNIYVIRNVWFTTCSTYKPSAWLKMLFKSNEGILIMLSGDRGYVFMHSCL